MRDDDFNDHPYSDTVRIPGVLVLPDDPWPTEFYSHYPEAFRIPARLLWRQDAPGPDEAAGLVDPVPAAVRPDRGELAPVATELEDGDTLTAPTAELKPAAHARRDPIDTFLQINDSLDRLIAPPPPVVPPSKIEIAASGDLRCDGFSAGCQSGGSWGATAGFEISGRALCRDCAVKFLGMMDQPGSIVNETLRRFERSDR